MTQPRGARQALAASAPIPDRRTRQREAVRRRILDAALELFAEQGYARTSVEEIAERADLARRTVFNHFPRKREMLDVWVAERRGQLSEQLAQKASGPATARRQLELQMEVMARGNEADPRISRVITLGWLVELGTFDDPFPVFDTFMDSVRYGQERGEFRRSVSAETVAEILSACYTDTLHRWLQSDHGQGASFDLLPALQVKFDLILDALSGVPGTS